MKGDDLAERFLNFAVRVLRLVASFPKTMPGKHVATQLVRSATSAGSNYEEARGAESRADFIHKMAVAWKETRESCYWLRLIHRAELVKPHLLDGLLREGNDLCAILAQSLKTARKTVAPKVPRESP